MTTEETPDLTDESGAGQIFSADSRHSTVSPWRKVRSFLGNLILSAFGGPASWPPVDVDLVDLSTGSVVKRWHEGGDEAAGLLDTLNDDLTTIARDEFIEKWDVGSE